MPRKTPSCLLKLRKRLQKAFGKNFSDNPVSSSLLTRKTVEERREEAVTYIVEKYFELKKREEAYIRRLESYGVVKRWLFERGREIKAVGMVFKEAVVKPVIITTMMFSVFLSILLAITVGHEITSFTHMYLPNPFNYMLDVVILFPIGFSPGVMSIILNYYREKKKLLRLLKDYDLEL